MLDLYLFDFLDCSSNENSGLAVLAKLKEVNCSAYKSEVHRWLNLRCSFEPFQSRGDFIETLVADCQVMHGYIVVLIQQESLLVALNSRGKLIMSTH